MFAANPSNAILIDAGHETISRCIPAAPCSLLKSHSYMFILVPLDFYLHQLHSNGGDTSLLCGECRRKRSGTRVYHCTVCDYHLHAVCAKNMINGLHKNGIKNKEKARMFGTAARLASVESQVVIEFIGGLIEGIREGVAEALAESVTRSRGGNGRRRGNVSSDAHTGRC